VSTWTAASNCPAAPPAANRPRAAGKDGPESRRNPRKFHTAVWDIVGRTETPIGVRGNWSKGPVAAWPRGEAGAPFLFEGEVKHRQMNGRDGGERSFTWPGPNGKVAPLPAIRRTVVEPRGSTLSGHSGAGREPRNGCCGDSGTPTTQGTGFDLQTNTTIS
jgi:hypothetical protein